TGLRILEVPRAALQGWAHASRWLEKARLARRVDPSWLEPLKPLVASSEKAKRELGWKPKCPTNVAVIERLKRVVPCAPDPRVALFLWTSAFAVDRKIATVDLGGFDSRIHLCLTGP